MKRKREMDKKAKADAKRQRRLQKKQDVQAEDVHAEDQLGETEGDSATDASPSAPTSENE